MQRDLTPITVKYGEIIHSQDYLQEFLNNNEMTMTNWGGFWHRIAEMKVLDRY